MFYNQRTESFNRKIWQFFNVTYRRRVPQNEREPISPDVIKRYIGIPIHRYREYIAEAASAAGYELDCYKLKWMITIPTRKQAESEHIQSTTLTNYPEFYYLHHRLELKQTYLTTITHTNYVLENRISQMLEKLVQASIVIRHKSSRIHARKLENLILWLLNEQLSDENRIVVRVSMYKHNMPYSLWSHYGYYRNCAISLDANLSKLVSSVGSLTSREPEFSVGKGKRGKGSRSNDKG